MTRTASVACASRSAVPMALAGIGRVTIPVTCEGSLPTVIDGVALPNNNNMRPHARQQKASYSITSSAVCKKASGIERSSALAVLRFMTNSNLVGVCTGRSAGLLPLRMRPV